MPIVNLTSKVTVNSYGYGLVEMMIALALIGITIISFHSTVASSLIQGIRAEQHYVVQLEARNILSIMQRELSRAGYVQRKQARGTMNPFIYSLGHLFQLNSQGNCIRYRYDRDKNGTLGQENFGFRLHHGGVQLRKGSNANCEGRRGWEAISDSASIQITQLLFTVTSIANVQHSKINSYVEIQLKIRHRQFPKMVMVFSRNLLVRRHL